MRGINIISMLIGFWGFNIFPILAQTQVKPESIDNLICFWSFMEESGTERISSGRCQYALREGTPFIERVKEGVFGEYSARIKEGEWFYIPRAQCPALNIHGKDGEVTVVAWIKRDVKQYSQCEAVAGMWDETRKKRQYCLFLDLRIWGSSQQAGGHVSGTGGATEGYKYCMDAAIGKSKIPYSEWECIGFTYDTKKVSVYVNGYLDVRKERSPYQYDLGLFDGGYQGSDFTVGAVNRSGEMGNFFVGQIGGLAVYDRALTKEEMRYLSSNINK